MQTVVQRGAEKTQTDTTGQDSAGPRIIATSNLPNPVTGKCEKVRMATDRTQPTSKFAIYWDAAD